jgi:hypothetical protein
MNIDELLKSFPSGEDLADAIGFHSAGRSANDAGELLPALAIFGTGMMIGAGMALLFAPKEGTKLREEIARTAGNLGDQARELVAEARAGSKEPQPL